MGGRGRGAQDGGDVGDPSSRTAQESTVYYFKIMYKPIHIICHYMKIYSSNVYISEIKV